MELVGAAVATWASVHIVRLIAIQFNRYFVPIINLGLGVFFGIGWGIVAGAGVWGVAAVVGGGAILNRLMSLTQALTDNTLQTLHNRRVEFAILEHRLQQLLPSPPKRS